MAQKDMSKASQAPPQSASLALQNLPPRNQSLRRRPSAREAVDSFVSPLARLEIEGRIANGWVSRGTKLSHVADMTLS